MAVVARHVTMRHTKLVLFMALIVAADAAIPADWDVSGLDVKVFTKVASPFSERGDDCTGAPELEEPCKALGFSHEFLDKLLAVAFPGKLLTKTTIFVKEAHNDGIFEHIQSGECINGTTTSTDGQTKKLLCLGAASISITTEREKTMDFLPSYFESGLKVMVAGHTDPWQLITDVLRKLGQSLLWIFAMFVLFVLLLFPFVWVLEMLIGGARATRGLPIFISRRELAYETEKIEEQWAQDHPQGSPQEKETYLKWRRQSFIELQSIKNAIQWTASVLAGYTVAYPKANAARMVRSIGNMITALLTIALTAIATAIFTASTVLNQQSKVQSLCDLQNRKVCAVSGTAPYNFLKKQSCTLNVLPNIQASSQKSVARYICYRK